MINETATTILANLYLQCGQDGFQFPEGQGKFAYGVSFAFDNKENVTIMQSTNRGIPFLETLEAIWQREIHLTINTKDEYRSRELTIKL